MNIFSGKISNIEVSKSLSLVSVKVGTTELKVIVVETPDTALYLTRGTTVDLVFKETEVIVATAVLSPISIQNKIKGSIRDIEQGIILSKVCISSDIGDITAIVPTEALSQMELIEDQQVVVMVKVNEIMISG